jgi:hypothetical protein
MEVEGRVVSLTSAGRTRDSRFDLFGYKSDLVCRQNGLNPSTGRGSPPRTRRNPMKSKTPLLLSSNIVVWSPE